MNNIMDEQKTHDNLKQFHMCDDNKNSHFNCLKM